MRLKAKHKAPAFQTTDTQGRIISLDTTRTKPLFLAFFRYASCPLCNLRISELIRYYDELQEKVDIVAVFQSPEEKIHQFVGRQDIPFAVISDPEQYLYKLYQVEDSWFGMLKSMTLKISTVFRALGSGFKPGSIEGKFNRIPADFLIDTTGDLIFAYYGNDIGDHLPLNKLR